MPSQLLVSPDGTLTSVPENQVNDALDPNKGGFTRVPTVIPGFILGVSPSGTLTNLPQAQANDAFDPAKGGFKTLDYYNKVNTEADRQRPIYESTFGAAGGLNPEFDSALEAIHNEHKDDDIFGAKIGNDKSFKMQLRGQVKDVPIGQVDQYLDQGYEFKDQNFQALVDAHVQLQKQFKSGSAGSTFINNAATLFGKGNEGGIEAAIGDRNLLANYVAEKVMEKEHPVAKLAGEVTSAASDVGLQKAAGLLGPTEKIAVSEGKTALGRAANFVATNAVDGARVMYPQAAVTAVVDKDPKLASEQLLLGAGIGVGFGALGKGAGALFTSLEKPATSEIDAAITKEVSAATSREEVENAFRKSLIANGIGEKTTEKEASGVLTKLSEGENMRATLEKLDPYLTEKASISNLQTKIAELGESLKQADPNVRASTELLSENLTKLADKEGKIALTDLQKYISNIEPGKGIATSLNQEVKNAAFKELINLGDSAAANADAKTVAEWINSKSVSNIARSLKLSTIDLGVPNAFSGVFKLVKSFATHKIAHLATGALLGGHIGGPMGSAVGMGIGMAAHKIEHWIENYVSNPENASKLGKWLSGKASSPNAARFLIMDAAHVANQNLQKVQPFIQQVGTKTATTFATKESPIKQILGPQSNGLSKSQQFDRLSSHLATLAGNPQIRDEHLKSVLAPIAEAHPGLAQQMKEDYDNKIQYLHQIMPKNPNPPQAFSKKDDWKPSAAELADFENHLKIAQNPYVLLDKMKEGKLTPKEVATAAMLNPAILNHIRDEMALAAFSGKVNMTYQQKLSAALIMGSDINQSLNNVHLYQGIYGSVPAESQPVPPGASGGKGRKGSASHLSADKSSKSSQTTYQRIMSK